MAVFGDPKALKILYRLLCHFWGSQSPQWLGSYPGLTDEVCHPTALLWPPWTLGRADVTLTMSFLCHFLLQVRKLRTQHLPVTAHLRTSPSCMQQPTQHPVNNCMFPTPLPLLLGNLFCLWTWVVRFPCSVLCRAWQEAGGRSSGSSARLRAGASSGIYPRIDLWHITTSLSLFPRLQCRGMTANV